MDFTRILLLLLSGMFLGKADAASHCGEKGNVTCVDAYIGDDVILFCPLMEMKKYPTWRKVELGHDIAIATDNNINRNVPGLSERVNVINDIRKNIYNLTIHNTTEKDKGKYCCVNLVSSKAVEFCSLLDIIEPNVTISQENSTLQCLLTKRLGEIEYTWIHHTRSGHRLPCNDKTGAILNLMDLEVSGGAFTCRVTIRDSESEDGNVIGEATVVRKDELVCPSSPLIHCDQKTVNITFQITNAEELYYEWLRENVIIDGSGNGSLSHYKENGSVQVHACKNTFSENATNFVLQIENIRDEDYNVTYTLHVVGNSRNISCSHTLKTGGTKQTDEIPTFLWVYTSSCAVLTLVFLLLSVMVERRKLK